jgi:hypothetical protein
MPAIVAKARRSPSPSLGVVASGAGRGERNVTIIRRESMEAGMGGFLARLTQAVAHPVLALCGLFGVFGGAPAGAAPVPERSALEGRVADMRRYLSGPAAREGVDKGDTRTLVAQAGKWNNWPNWSNWANWRNG